MLVAVVYGPCMAPAWRVKQVDSPITWLPATYKIPPRLPDPDVTFSSVRLGPIPGRHQLLIRPSDLQRWARLHGDSVPPVAYAPPSILYFASMNLLGREWKGGGFARYAAEFLAPVPIGRPVAVSAEVTDKYVRRGRGRIVWRLEAYDEGVLIQRHWKVWAFAIAPEEGQGWPGDDYHEKPFGDWAANLPPLTEPKPLAAIELPITLERMTEFEGPGEDNVHTNVVKAKASYGVGPVAQGELSFGLLCRMLRDAFGGGFETGGTLDVRFIRAVYAGDVVTARGEIVSGDGEKAGCRVWAENQRGEPVTVGTATAWLASR